MFSLIPVTSQTITKEKQSSKNEKLKNLCFNSTLASNSSTMHVGSYGEWTRNTETVIW